MKKNFISLKIIRNCQKAITTVIIFLFVISAKSNVNFNFDVALFSLGKTKNSDVLFQYKPSIAQWIKVGNTGTTQIQSIAIDTENFIIYAVNGGTLGTLNPVTAEFTKIGSIGGGNGAYGYKNINQVYGLTFDPIEKTLYATSRINTSNDILVKINPFNGQLIKKTFFNFSFQKIDYVIIEAPNSNATINNNTSHPLADVTSIIYEPITGQLLGLQHRYDKIAMSLISKHTGFLLEVIFDLSSTGILSIDYDLMGNIYATTLNEINTENGIIPIDLGFVKVNLINPSSANIPDLKFISLAFIKTNNIIQQCKDQINLICTSPQLPEIKAKQAIHSNTDISVNTTYKTAGYVSLHDHFSIPNHIDFSIDIENICD